tara:strand:- start:2496 stop:3170 length:675 start_codon:yes stop_codon:yes gene_type:complete
MSEFQKNYVENIESYFESKLEDDQRLFVTINRFLKFHNLGQMRNNHKLLDLGSGKGTFIEVCKKNGLIATGLDAANGKINFEKDKLPFEDNSFDFISMIAVIEHIKEKNILINEIKRVAKNNASLIVTTPNFKYCYKSFYDDPTHVSPYTEVSLEKFFINHGIKYNKIAPLVINKGNLFWETKFKFFLASILPFRNHDFKNSKLIPNFLRGKSTSILSVSKILK